MPVTVKLGGNARERTYQDGEDVAVDDVGCLVITCGDGKTEKTLAVYAPGMWVSGEVT